MTCTNDTGGVRTRKAAALPVPPDGARQRVTRCTGHVAAQTTRVPVAEAKEGQRPETESNAVIKKKHPFPCRMCTFYIPGVSENRKGMAQLYNQNRIGMRL